MKKRFSDFYNLHYKLKKHFGYSVSKFPSRMVFGNIKKENVEKRMKELQNYLNQLSTNERICVSRTHQIH